MNSKKARSKQKVVVMGIDVGLAIMGWSILEYDKSAKIATKLIQYGVVTTESTLGVEDRLLKVFEDLTTLIKEFKPEEAAIESLFYFKNQKTVMNISQVRGVIVLAARMNNLDVFNYTPLQVKTSVTGYGRAEKKQIQKIIKNMFKLDDIPKPDDAADAIAIGVCHINSYY